MNDLLEQLDPSWDVEMSETKACIEAILFMSHEPVTLETLSEACDMPLDSVKHAMGLLIRDYESSGRGLSIHQIGGGYQILTKPQCAEAINRFRIQERPMPNLSRAALEVLAIIAYKQPVTRAEIESLRGVSSESAVKTLADRGLISEVGRKAVIGKPSLFGTTDEFLKRFGLFSLSDLPPLKAAENISE